MPLPKPTKGEQEDKFIARCMTFQDKEKDLGDESTRKQALAICYNIFRKTKTEERINKFSGMLLDSIKE